MKSAPSRSAALPRPWRWLRQLHLAVNSPSHRLTVQLSIDLTAWIVAVIVVTGLAGGDLGPATVARILAALSAQGAVGLLTGIYVRHFSYAGPEDMRRTALAGAVAVVAVQGASWLVDNRWTLLLSVAVGLLGTALTIGSRHVIWSVIDRWRRPQGAGRVIIVGVGHTGASLAAQMLRDQESTYLPAAFVDDDPSKRHLRVHGVPVLGTTGELAEVGRHRDAVGVVVAIRRADKALLARLSGQLAGTGMWIRVLPMLRESVDSPVSLNDIRELTAEDLLGRRPVRIDERAVRTMMEGKRVLITGAGGSIGSELTRQIAGFGPAELIMLDRDETALHALKISLTGRATLDTPDTVLADLRDARRIHQVFDEHRPEIVFHAAALKHLPLLEQYPAEAWQTNVHGTIHVLEAARDAGVATLINVSTDKAAEPSSILGKSKRTAEQLTAHYGRPDQLRLSVRFGNVLGSRGSVLYSFADQIRRGGPVTITHPEVTRYFMTIPEACQLMLQAAAIGSAGEVLVLEMGQAFKIVDVARRMMEMGGRDCEIVYTGLRPGEKLNEVLFTSAEVEHAQARVHEKIFHADVEPLDPATIPGPAAEVATVLDFWRRHLGASTGDASLLSTRRALV